MKCSFLVSALLTVMSLRDTFGTSYDCKVDGNYDIIDDPDNPLLPTITEQEWAASRIKTSFNAVHSVYNNDFTIDTITVQSFDHDPAQLAIDDTKDALDILTRLRGSKKKQETTHASWIRWRMRLKAKNKIGCFLCKNWDDDDAMSVTVDFDAGETHSRWEAAWCDELQQGGVLVFEYSTDCTIDLYDCTLISEEIGVNIPGPTTVSDGMRQIKAEVEAEIADQEMNEE